ncbi:Protein of unknown function, partial [Gryllus bimaculatus]
MLLGLAGPASLHAYRPQGRKLAERRAAVARSDPNVTNPNKESATNVPTAPVLEASTCTQQKENPGPSGKLPLHQVLPSDEEKCFEKLQTPFVSTGPSNNISKQSEMNTEMGSSVTDTSAHSATSACKNPKCLVHTLLADREEPKVHATASTTNKEEQVSELPTDSMEQKGEDSSQVLSSGSTPNLEQEEKEKTLVIEPSTSTPSSNTSLAKVAYSETPRVQNDRDPTTAASSNIAQNVESAPLVAFLMPPNYGSAVAKSKGKKKSSGRKLEDPLASATHGYETPHPSISGTKNDQKTPSVDSLLPQYQVSMADPSGNVSKIGKCKTEPARKGLNPAVPSPVSNTPLADRLHSLIHQSSSEFSADMTSVSQPSGRSKQKSGKKSKAFMKPAETAVSSELPVPSTSSGITASSSDRSLPQARRNESVVRAPLRTVSGGNILHAIDHARMNAPNRPLPPTLAAQRSQRGATPDVTRLISPGPAYARNAFEQSYINASRGTLVDDPNIARYAKRIKVQPYYFPVMQQAENPTLSAWRNAQYNQPSTSTAAQATLPGPSQGGNRLYVHPAGDTSQNRNQTATPSPQESAGGRATIQADGTFRIVPNAGFITPSAGRTPQTSGGTSYDTSSSGAARTRLTTGSTSSHTSHSVAKPQTTGGTSCNTASSGMSRLIANPTVGSNFAMSPPGTAPTTSQTAGRASYDISISGGTGTTLTTGGAISGDSSSKKLSTTPQTTGGTRPSPPASGISGTMSQASAEASSAPLPTGGVRASKRGGGVSRSKNRARSEKEIPAGGSGGAGDASVDDGRNREPPQALRGDTPQAEDTPGVKLEASSTGGNMQETGGEPLPNDLPDWVSPHLVNDYYRAMHLSTHLEGRNHFTRRRRDEKSPKCSEHFRGFWNINWAPLLQEKGQYVPNEPMPTTPEEHEEHERLSPEIWEECTCIQWDDSVTSITIDHHFPSSVPSSTQDSSMPWYLGESPIPIYTPDSALREGLLGPPPGFESHPVPQFFPDFALNVEESFANSLYLEHITHISFVQERCSSSLRQAAPNPPEGMPDGIDLHIHSHFVPDMNSDLSDDLAQVLTTYFVEYWDTDMAPTLGQSMGNYIWNFGTEHFPINYEMFDSTPFVWQSSDVMQNLPSDMDSQETSSEFLIPPTIEAMEQAFYPSETSVWNPNQMPTPDPEYYREVNSDLLPISREVEEINESLAHQRLLRPDTQVATRPGLETALHSVEEETSGEGLNMNPFSMEYLVRNGIQVPGSVFAQIPAPDEIPIPEVGWSPDVKTSTSSAARPVSGTAATNSPVVNSATDLVANPDLGFTPASARNLDNEFYCDQPATHVVISSLEIISAPVPDPVEPVSLVPAQEPVATSAPEPDPVPAGIADPEPDNVLDSAPAAIQDPNAASDPAPTDSEDGESQSGLSVPIRRFPCRLPCSATRASPRWLPCAFALPPTLEDDENADLPLELWGMELASDLVSILATVSALSLNMEPYDPEEFHEQLIDALLIEVTRVGEAPQERATDANEAAVSSILAAKTQREPEASGADTSTNAASAAGTSATETEIQLEPEAPRADTPANVASAGGTSASETAEIPSKHEVPRE